MGIYEIKAGDTFWNLAKANGISVEAIKNANPKVIPTELQIGQTISIPDDVGMDSVNFKTVLSSTKNNTSTQSNNKLPDKYIIKEKDTFYDIAKKGKVSLDLLKKVNPGVVPEKLKVGQEIVIPNFYTKKQLVEKIKTASKKYGVDENLALAVVQHESKFNPYVKSSAGAVGLFQLTTTAATQVKGKKTYAVDDNIEYGIKYLKWCIDHTETMEEALVAYNAGISKLNAVKKENSKILEKAKTDGINPKDVELTDIDSITNKKNNKGYAENVLEIYKQLKAE